MMSWQWKNHVSCFLFRLLIRHGVFSTGVAVDREVSLNNPATAGLLLLLLLLLLYPTVAVAALSPSAAVYPDYRMMTYLIPHSYVTCLCLE
jgi:hypothetical protein